MSAGIDLVIQRAVLRSLSVHSSRFPPNKSSILAWYTDSIVGGKLLAKYPKPPSVLDATVTSGSSLSDAVLVAPAVAGFQDITEWANGASIDLSVFVNTSQTIFGPRGGIVYTTPQSPADKDKAERFLGILPIPLELADNLELLDPLEMI